MAGVLNDAEFRLPSEFLADDFFLDKKSGEDGSGGGVNGGGGECCFPTEFPYELGYDSNLSSPVESVTGTESSDEEDYMAGLTQQMAHYFLQDDEKVPVSARAAGNPKGVLTVGSPQSTLCALGSFKASSRETSNVPSLVSSPPSTPLEPYKDDAWDLLYAAAGQVMRMRLNDEREQQQQQHHGGRGLLAPPSHKPSAAVPAALPKNAGCGYANLSLTQHQLRFSQYQQLTQQQMMKQQGAAAWSGQSRAKGGGPGGGLAGTRPTRPLGLSAAAWPPIQQQPSRSGMRAVFLNPASRRESCGTGVFLPRRVDNPTELRKKPACSTVLLPARVVQALNLNLDELGAHPRFPGAFALDHDAIIARSNAMLLQKRSYRHQPAPANLHHHRQQEICLPSEWTY